MRTSTNMSRTFLNTQKENIHHNRPQTAAHPDAYENEEERKPGNFVDGRKFVKEFVSDI